MTVSTVHICMVVSVCLSTYPCSFDVKVCLTVEPSSTAFEGNSVGESAECVTCVLGLS